MLKCGSRTSLHAVQYKCQAGSVLMFCPYYFRNDYPRRFVLQDSKPGFILSLFLFFYQNQDFCSYKIVLIKKECKNINNNILKEEKRLREKLEFFTRDRKKRKYGRYHIINEFHFAWYEKCASANVFPAGPMLQEKAMLIKDRLNNTDF